MSKKISCCQAAPRRWAGWRTRWDGPGFPLEVIITRRRPREDYPMTDIQFYDSADINKIPIGADYAAVYADGRYAVSGAEAMRFPHHQWITVLGVIHPGAGIADYEEGNDVYLPGQLADWVHVRHEHAKRAIVYCDRSNVKRALAELDGRGCHWWISTLDGRRWTPEELAADLKANHGVTIAASDIWACQYQGGPDAPYDTSDLFRAW